MGLIKQPELEDTSVAHNAHVTELLDKQHSKWQAIKKHPYAFFCVCSMIWLMVLASFENQAGGIVISIVRFREDFGYRLGDEYVLHSIDQSVLSGVPIATQILGQWFGAWLADRYGKKKTLYGAVLASCGFIALEFAATEMSMFIAGKSLLGFCLGVIQSCCVSYVSDVSPLVLRGFSITLCNISNSIGPMVCFIINYGLSGKDSIWSYRGIFAAQWGLAAVALLLLTFVPESPTFYILKGDIDQAEKSYLKLLGNPVDALNQVTVVNNTVIEAREVSKNSTYLDCFRGPNLKRTIIAIMPFILNPCSGVFFTGGYTTYFFQLSGFDEAKSFQYTCGAQSISIAGCIAAVYVVDKAGRRNNILFGVLGVIAVDFIIGGTATAASSSSGALDACIGFMMLYGGVYNMGLGCVCFPICAENPTSGLRTKTVGLGLGATNLCGMVWSFVLPYLFNPDRANLGGKTMFIFAGVSCLFWVFLFFFQTETAGRSYDEIDEMYLNNVPPRKFKTYVTKVSKVDLGSYELEKAELSHVEDKSISSV